jgi:hypothetical protein
MSPDWKVCRCCPFDWQLLCVIMSQHFILLQHCSLWLCAGLSLCWVLMSSFARVWNLRSSAVSVFPVPSLGPGSWYLFIQVQKRGTLFVTKLCGLGPGLVPDLYFSPPLSLFFSFAQWMRLPRPWLLMASSSRASHWRFAGLMTTSHCLACRRTPLSMCLVSGDSPNPVAVVPVRVI